MLQDELKEAIQRKKLGCLNHGAFILHENMTTRYSPDDQTLCGPVWVGSVAAFTTQSGTGIF
jgi:hypothetical protein